MRWPYVNILFPGNEIQSQGEIAGAAGGRKEIF